MGRLATFLSVSTPLALSISLASCGDSKRSDADGGQAGTMTSTSGHPGAGSGGAGSGGVSGGTNSRAGSSGANASSGGTDSTSGGANTSGRGENGGSNESGSNAAGEGGEAYAGGRDSGGRDSGGRDGGTTGLTGGSFSIAGSAGRGGCIGQSGSVTPGASPCEFVVAAPAGGALDVNRINVVLNGQTLPNVSDCAGNANGWLLLAGSPATIELCSGACDALSSPSANLTFEVGCSTVVD